MPYAEAFKVVKVEDHILVSCQVKEAPYSLTYTPNEWTAAKIGGCIAFRTLHDAEVFRDYIDPSTCEIWRVHGSGRVRLAKRRLAPHADFRPTTNSLVEVYWNNYRGLSKVMRRKRPGAAYTLSLLSLWPQGTVAYKRVKLLEKVA